MYYSLKKHCPQANLWILAMSDEAYNILQKMKLKDVTLIKLSDFEDKQLLAIKNTRAPVEYMWTLTPSLPLYIFKKNPALKMISYIDADCFFYSNPKPLYDELGEKSILLIEHRYSSDRRAWEKTSGRFNVSLLIFRRDFNGLKALRWWRDRCIEWCYSRYENGKLGDQMYLNDWPSRFNSVHILQHKGGGMAPWNIRNYQISQKNSQLFIDEDPLIFYHFHALKIFSQYDFELSSGYNLSKQEESLVYKPYLEAIRRAIIRVNKIDKDFYSGFSKVTLKHIIINKILAIKNLLWRK